MKERIELYPLRFREVYKQTIWGGNKIYQYKGNPAPAENIGETWEISPMEGDASVVAEGPLEGKDLIEVTREYGADLLGHQVFERFGGKFPLLIKLIDSQQDLSVQVHPNDTYAEKRHHSWGKTEMWYILVSEPRAKIYAGWQKQTSKEALPELVQTDAVMGYLEAHTPHPGDLFFLPAGKVHTIGAGNLLLEIQQASKITYRLFDFNRTDKEGHKRELHVADGVEVIDFSLNTHGAEPYDHETKDQPVPMVECSYFATRMLQLTHDYPMALEGRDSFTILFVDEGAISINGLYHLGRGELLLLPASMKEVTIETNGAKVLETFIPHVK